MTRVLLLCAALCPAFLIATGVLYLEGDKHGAACAIILAGSVDLFGYIAAVFEGKR